MMEGMKEGMRKEIIEEMKKRMMEEIMEGMRNEMMEEMKEKMMEGMKEKMMEGMMKDIMEGMRKEMKEEIKKKMMEEMRKDLMEEMKKKMTEGMMERLMEEMKKKMMEGMRKDTREGMRKEMVEEVKKKMMEGMRKDIMEEMKKKMMEGMRIGKMEEMKKKIMEEMREGKMEEMMKEIMEQLNGDHPKDEQTKDLEIICAKSNDCGDEFGELSCVNQNMGTIMQKKTQQLAMLTAAFISLGIIFFHSIVQFSIMSSGKWWIPFCIFLSVSIIYWYTIRTIIRDYIFVRQEHRWTLEHIQKWSSSAGNGTHWMEKSWFASFVYISCRQIIILCRRNRYLFVVLVAMSAFTSLILYACYSFLHA